MKISVITTVLNAVNSIEKTINSVLGQNYDELEYIVIDAGSTDGTLDVINKYMDRIDYFISEPDGGTFFGMNKGIRVSSGQVIGILNADDEYLPDTLNIVNDYFSDENVDVLYGNVFRVYENGFSVTAQMCTPDTLNYKMGIVHPAVFVKREAYFECGMYDTSYKYSSDYEFMLRLYRRGANIVAADRILAKYDMSGISAKNRKESYEECKCISEKYLLSLEDAEKYRRLLNEQEIVRESVLKKDKEEILLIEKAGKLLESICGDRKIYIYGSGRDSVISYKIVIRSGMDFAGYIDNDKKKQGTLLGNYPILSQNVLDNDRVFVFISSRKYETEIADLLLRKNYVRKNDFISLTDCIRGE